MKKRKIEAAKASNPVKIFEYDKKWPMKFSKEKARILEALGKKIVAVEHIGSTSVHGMCAKPIIDIMVGIERLSDSRHYIPLLESIGYEYVPEYEVTIPERRYFRKGPSDMPNKHFHLHMVEYGGVIWKDQLLFRDYLRTHPAHAQKYGVLKKRLAEKHRTNREAYTEAKTGFIKSTIHRASKRSI